MAKKYSAFIILIAVTLSSFGLFLPAHASENISIGATVTVHVDRANQQIAPKSSLIRDVLGVIATIAIGLGISLLGLLLFYLRYTRGGGKKMIPMGACDYRSGGG